MAQLWWAELEDTNSLGTEAEHLCTVICASAVVLIPSSTIVRGKKLFKKKKHKKTPLFKLMFTPICIICPATLLDKIPNHICRYL